MRRREFLTRCSVFTAGLVLGAPSLSRAHQPAHPLEVGAGPQLFLDDYLIDQLDGLTRHVETPKRLPKPVLDSATFGTTQPYLTVLHDTERHGYRIWYNRDPRHLARRVERRRPLG